MAVFLTTDAAGFDFEDDAELGAFLEEFLGNLQVFIQRHDGAVEHVGLEQRAFACGDALAGGFQQRLEESIDLGRVAVVGVEGDQDVVFLREEVAGFGQDDGTEGGVLDGGAGGELAAAGGNLDDSVGFRFGKSAERTVDGGERGDVDGGVGVAAFLGGVQHGAVLRGSCDWHNGVLVSKRRADDKPESA